MSDFMGQVINQIVILKSTIVITLIGILCFLVVFLILTSKFSWIGKNSKLIGFFYVMSSKHAIMFGIIWVKFFVVLSIIYEGGNIYPAHMCVYFMAEVLYILNRHKLMEGALAMLNTVIIVFTLYVASFLHSYLVQVTFNAKVQILLILIEIFLLVYSMFDIIWSLIHITSEEEVSWNVYKEIDKRTIERQKLQAERELESSKRRAALQAKQKTAEITRKKELEIAQRALGESK